MSRTRRVSGISDRRDESRAVFMRDELGRDGWLVSWSQEAGGGWRARVSCRSLEETFEAVGKSRCAAIRKASLKLLDSYGEMQARMGGVGWYDHSEYGSEESDRWWRGEDGGDSF